MDLGIVAVLSMMKELGQIVSPCVALNHKRTTGCIDHHIDSQDKLSRKGIGDLLTDKIDAISDVWTDGIERLFRAHSLRINVQVGDRSVSYARNVKVVFPNEDLHELDVVCLPTGQMPICIECKSGEFRREIDKYLRLSKRLGVGKERFIVCSTDLTEAQAQGLTAMYDLSFVNLQTLKKHLQKII